MNRASTQRRRGLALSSTCGAAVVCLVFSSLYCVPPGELAALASEHKVHGEHLGFPHRKDPRSKKAAANSAYEQGNRLADHGEFGGAANMYNRALHLDPTFIAAYYKGGWAYTQADEPERALEVYAKLQKLDPNSAEMYDGMGRAQRKAGNLKEALAYFSRAISLDPKIPIVYLSRADVENQLAMHTQAIKDYSKYLEVDPGFDGL
ncbi:MAG: tetratricopeptide repeat protein, partial [Terriglobales bacterium]